MALGPMLKTKAEEIVVARSLLRGARSATLSTGMADDEGWAYGSLVTVATDFDGSPLMLFSNLSDHTQNLAADNRGSLLFERGSRRRNPQTGPRVTVMGRIAKTTAKAHARRFLARHPEAKMYAGFGDFNFYRMKVERIHMVGGFARARWMQGRDLLADRKAATAIGKAESDIIAHMNADHADAVDLYATRILRRRDGGWRMIGVDPDGADLVRDGRFARLEFSAPVSDAIGVREELVRLVGVARARATKA